jgi:hypothetical protein
MCPTDDGEGGQRLMDVARVRWARQGALVAAVAGVVGLITIVLFSIGQPWGTLNDLSLVVMTAALAPVMLGSYELGGATPLWPARLSLAGGIGGIAIWCVIQAAMIGGLVTFDDEHGATGAYGIQTLAHLVIGAWLTGAPRRAGPWLPPLLRWLGAASGLGFVLLGAGLLVGGVNHPLTWLGGVGYEIAFPIWALLLNRHLRGIEASNRGR